MASPTPPLREPISEEVENLLHTYHVTADWIRFADAKAAAVLTVGGVLAGLLVPRLRIYFDTAATTNHPLPGWTFIVLALFLVWLISQGVSAIMAFLCIMPFRRKGRHPVLQHSTHFHGAAISAHYKLEDVEKFIADFDALGTNGFKKQVLAALLIDAHISTNKYRHVSNAIRVLAFSAVFALLFVLAIQF